MPSFLSSLGKFSVMPKVPPSPLPPHPDTLISGGIKQLWLALVFPLPSQLWISWTRIGTGIFYNQFLFIQVALARSSPGGVGVGVSSDCRYWPFLIRSPDLPTILESHWFLIRVDAWDLLGHLRTGRYRGNQFLFPMADYVPNGHERGNAMFALHPVTFRELWVMISATYLSFIWVWELLFLVNNFYKEGGEGSDSFALRCVFYCGIDLFFWPEFGWLKLEVEVRMENWETIKHLSPPPPPHRRPGNDIKKIKM